MTTPSARPVLSTAAVAALLLLAPMHGAEVQNASDAAPKATTTGSGKQTTIPTRSVRDHRNDHRNKVIRDHRGVPQRVSICAGWFC